MHIPDPHAAQLGGADTGDVGELAHHVVTASHRRLAGLSQRVPEPGEELLGRALGRRYPQPEVTAVMRPVERVDRATRPRNPEPAADLACVTLLQKREVAVEQTQLLPHRRPGTLARPREVPIDLPRRQPPRRHAVVLADLDHRADQPVQRRRSQSRDITCPLVLNQRVEEEAPLIRSGHPRRRATLHRHDVCQPRLNQRTVGGFVVGRDAPARHERHERQRATPGIGHSLAD